MKRIACPPPVTPDLKAVAYHEAGHVVVGTRLGLEVVSTDIEPDAEGGNAHTQFAGPGDWFQPDPGQLTERERDLIERVVTTFMAGFAAESRSGHADPEGSGYDAAAAFRQWLGYLEPVPERRERLAGEFSARAEAELKRPAAWSAVQRVAGALLGAGRLDGAEVRRLIAGA